MLRPITNRGDLRRALKALGREINLCEECRHVWTADAKEQPVPCPRRDCRLWGTGKKYDAPRMPPAEANQCAKIIVL